MGKYFFTNRDGNTLLYRFNNLLKLNIINLDMIVGYFRLSGFYEIGEEIKNIPEIRVLIGINLDQGGFNAIERGKSLNLSQDKEITAKFISEQNQILEKESYHNKIEKSYELVEDLIKNGKLKIKIHQTKKVHAKVYIFREKPLKNHDGTIDYRGGVITGSSNFSQSGLKNNIEINIELRESQQIEESIIIFEQLWKEGIEVTEDDIDKIVQNSYIPILPPYQLYIKFLMEYFGERINLTSEDLPEGYKNLSYQTDAVNQAWEILKEHNGAFLGDVVGLGKTVIAVRIIQKFISHIKEESILIITPPAIKSNWERTLKEFSIHRYYQIISTGSLHKIKYPEKYGIVIIDESHQFKNFNTERYKELERICKTPTYKGERKKILLLSATPMNNKPEDLANQLYLFQDKRESTIPSIINLEAFFANLKKRYQEALSLKEEKDQTKQETILKNIAVEIREKILKPVMVRRTRTNILNIASYKADLEDQNIFFPKVNPVEKMTYEFDEETEELFVDTIDILTNKLNYYRYQALKYLKDEPKERLKKKQKTQEGFYEMIAEQLAKLMKILLIKRIESSFQAFKESLYRICKYTSAFIKMFENNKIYIAPKVNPIDYLLDDKEEELIKLLNDNPEKGEVFKSEDFEDGYLDNIKKDLTILEDLWLKWADIKNDPKLEQFKIKLNNIVKKYKKVIIFTESKDTAIYLKEKINKKDILSISADNRSRDEEKIIENFDANHKKQKDDYNILITTETLSEGINLHRSQIIINYDIPWNSTKLIQRIGRINRIGTPHKEIFIYNFIPTKESENEIGLKNRAYVKLQTFHNTLGSDNQIFLNKEVVQSFQIFNDTFSSDDQVDESFFLEELREFKQNNPTLFDKIKRKPNKIRTIRKGDIKKSSLIYFRNGKFQKFYKIGSDKIDPISFIEMGTILRSHPDEREISKIPDIHFKHIEMGSDLFQKDIIEMIENRSIAVKTEHKTDKKAISILKYSIQSRGDFSDLDKDNFRELIKIIEKGVFQNISKEIVKAYKVIEKLRKKKNGVTRALLEKFSDNISKIIKQYHVFENRSIKKREIEDNIETILSETFI